MKTQVESVNLTYKVAFLIKKYSFQHIIGPYFEQGYSRVVAVLTIIVFGVCLWYVLESIFKRLQVTFDRSYVRLNNAQCSYGLLWVVC